MLYNVCFNHLYLFYIAIGIIYFISVQLYSLFFITALFYCSPKFGKVITLTKGSFVEAIDKEKAGVTVVVHIYEDVSKN